MQHQRDRSTPSTRQRILIAMIASGVAIMASTAQAGGVPVVGTIGDGPGCTHVDLQTALDTLPNGSTLRLARAVEHLSAPLEILGGSFRIEGGYASCDDIAPMGRTTLDADFVGDSVVRVTAEGAFPADVSFSNIDIVGGNAVNGGGMLVSGNAAVLLQAVDVYNNVASQNGGGIRVSGADARLTLVGGTRIGVGPAAANSAGDEGGGISCVFGRVFLGASQITHNTSATGGGGIALSNCDLDSVNEMGELVIAANTARDGGGIRAAVGSVVSLDTFAQLQIRIEDNQALEQPMISSGRGGGIFLTDAGTLFKATGVNVTGNHAESAGGALQLRTGSSARFAASASGCATNGRGCSLFSANSAGGNGTLALVNGGASLSLQQTRIRDQNGGGAMLALAQAGTLGELGNVTVTGNSSTSLFSVGNGSRLVARYATIVDNQFAGPAITLFDPGAPAVTLQKSIFLVDGGQSHIENDPAVHVFSCLNTGAGGALGGDVHDPGFVDAAAGDYHLQPGSANIDRCAADVDDPAYDFDFTARLHDVPELIDDSGPFDRGAFEFKPALLSNGFE